MYVGSLQLDNEKNTKIHTAASMPDPSSTVRACRNRTAAAQVSQGGPEQKRTGKHADQQHREVVPHRRFVHERRHEPHDMMLPQEIAGKALLPLATRQNQGALMHSTIAAATPSDADARRAGRRSSHHSATSGGTVNTTAIGPLVNTPKPQAAAPAIHQAHRTRGPCTANHCRQEARS